MDSEIANTMKQHGWKIYRGKTPDGINTSAPDDHYVYFYTEQTEGDIKIIIFANKNYTSFYVTEYKENTRQLFAEFNTIYNAMTFVIQSQKFHLLDDDEKPTNRTSIPTTVKT